MWLRECEVCSRHTHRDGERVCGYQGLGRGMGMAAGMFLCGVMDCSGIR